MSLLGEIETLKVKLQEVVDRYNNLSHSCVVCVSQQLDQKLNEYNRQQPYNSYSR